MAIEAVLKIAGKTLKQATRNNVWSKITRKEIVGFNAIQEAIAGIPKCLTVPEKAANMTHIRGTYQNGSFADFLLFRDIHGKRLGSYSLYPNGKLTEITIKEAPFYAEHTPNDTFIGRLIGDGFKSRAKIYEKRSYLPNGTSELKKTFSEVFKKKNDKRLFQSVIRTNVKSTNTATDKMSQEIIQIEKNNNLTRNFVETDIEVAKDGTILNQAINSSNNIHIDTSNPYHNNGLLDADQMLQIQYSRIAEERGYKGIEPEIGLERFSFDDQCTRMDCAKIYMSLKPFYEGRLSKSQLVKHLGHECEHLFEQATTIQRSGIVDLVKPEFREYITFYDDVINRFGKIQKDSPEYKKAEMYVKDILGYNNIYDAQQNIRPEIHSDLKIEKLADKKGFIERDLFEKCLENYEANFSLFNRKYANFNNG